jgi:heat shock protein HslJ
MNTRRLAIVTMVVATALLALTACGPSDPLAGTSWKMELEGDQAYSELASATGITITFADDSTFTGKYTYSKFAGEYVVDGRALTFLGPCYTSMACQAAEGIDAQSQFLFSLEAVESFAIDGDTLTMHTDETDMVFERS